MEVITSPGVTEPQFSLLPGTDSKLGKTSGGGGMNWFYWALRSAGFAGLTAILAKIGTTGVEPNLATAIRTSVVLVLAWGVTLAGGAPRLDLVSGRAMIALVFSGLATGLSWLCYFRALHLGQASSVAPVDKLSVVFTMILAATLLGEPLTWRHACGGSLITLGAVLIVWK